MSPRARLILTGVLSLLVAVAFFYFFIKPRQAELAEVREEIEAEENRTTQLQAELARLQDLQANAPRLQADLARMRELIPPTHEVPSFIFIVQEAANASGVGFLRIGPELPDAPQEGAPLAEVRMSLNAKGGYFAIQDFIRRLYALDRALRVDVMSLSGEESEGVVRVNLDVTSRIFFELPPGAAGTTPTTGTTTTTTGATPSPSPSPSP